MILIWDEISNIENSLIEFLRTAVSTNSLQLLDNNGVAKNVNVYAGRNLGNWDMPLIQVYYDSTPDANRLEVGSNKRLRSRQIIIEIRTLLPGQEIALGSWVETQINNGITIYDYAPNSINPDSPIKTIIGHGRVDFISSVSVPPFDDSDIYDKNRYRLSFKIWINK